ncbi:MULTISPECIES: diadenylate cyclase CdaA [Salimicrobium]|uniref:Diadenylate cyclase n=1 Tax=Salimicrobium humidisoli TaxID=2029857 RepID=A0ABX4HTW1_9BACI|nr:MULTISPECIES: diadenylate cyclase CdaA [Salimicrobium]PBB05951.1 TIGR00159 family protein [Salimicrobium humidisoli]
MFGEAHTLFDYIVIAIDIALVWFIIYKLIMLIQGTKAVQLLKGVFLILGIWLLSNLFGLTTLRELMSQAIAWGFLAIIILFQPELRRALEQLGRGSFFSRSSAEEENTERSVEAILKSCNYMAKRRIGALITIERETGMGDYVETGIPVHGELTNELLTNIFIPNTPLHDGAVILKSNKIVAAACYLPLSESPFISKELGTRHRAAMGISEVTDALTIIVSEETGNMSCTVNGELQRNLDEESLRKILHSALDVTSKTPANKSWNWRGKKNG